MAFELDEEKTFEGLLAENKAAGKTPMFLYFWASWHAPCKQMGAVFDTTAQDYKHLKFVKIEAEKFPDIAEKYPVESVPTFVVIRGGSEVVESLEGADVPKLVALVTKHAKAAGSSVPTATVQPTEDLNTRLGKLVRAAPVMVFMKGSPEDPKCGFSRKMVALLKEVNVKGYGFFDILSDQEVRTGLKEFSNWPTYPQLYVKGEMVGGLDVCKDMHEAGEFEELFPRDTLQGEELNKHIKELIERQRVMLFMKGDPSAPKCGFSNKMCALLKEVSAEFGTFDILTDSAVREGIKTYSNWPTFPQLYVDGELLGGLDVCKEMHEEGELAELVAKNSKE
jgi:Grx4 family monothiol glutaredoxin